MRQEKQPALVPNGISRNRCEIALMKSGSILLASVRFVA